MQTLVEDFLQYLRHERGQAEHTQRTYASLLNKFVAWAQDQKLTDWKQVELRHLMSFLGHERERTLAHEPRESTRRLSGESVYLEIAALRAAANQALAGPQSGGDWGDDANPLVTRLEGDAHLTGSIRAAGIVLVDDAPLRIEGDLTVRGLLLAPAGIEVRGSLVVEGAIWIGTSFAIPSPGSLELVDALDALAEAASAGHGALPLPATLAAWREVW